jgi:transcriptional regulator GlxA family with amidase domain
VKKPRRVVFVAYDGFQPLDLVGPHEVFDAVNRLRGTSEYRLDIASVGAQMIRGESGLAAETTVALDRIRGPLDTLMVVGGFGVRAARQDVEIVHHVKRLAAQSRRVSSVCTGALLLAQAGLLNGRRAVTHWASCEWMASKYPLVKVDPDPIYVRDGNVWTSAGVTAGIDLALAMVADDFAADRGEELVREIARWLVVFNHRPGGQAQFSQTITVPAAPTDSIRALVADLPTLLDRDCSVAVLAGRAAMSNRTFARRFRAETGRTPAEHVELLRVEAAKSRLQSSEESLSSVARNCGFGTVETMHRAFRRRVATTPDLYRRHFRRISYVH